MTAICNGTDLSDLIGYGYEYELVPQILATVTTLDGKDHSAKDRDLVHLKVPFIPLTASQLATVLQLFPAGSAYVTWTFTDLATGSDRTAVMKYEARTIQLAVTMRNGTEYWSGLTVDLMEQ